MWLPLPQLLALIMLTTSVAVAAAVQDANEGRPSLSWPQREQSRSCGTYGIVRQCYSFASAYTTTHIVVVSWFRATATTVAVAGVPPGSQLPVQPMLKPVPPGRPPRKCHAVLSRPVH